ncbi:MAG: rod shape-determining protein MreC [Fidelibacterota bacterium]
MVYILKKIYQFRNSIALVSTSIISLMLFFNRDSQIVLNVRADIADVSYFILYPKRAYQNLLSSKQENEDLKELLVQMQLMNAKLLRYKNENDQLKNMVNFVEESSLSLQPSSVVDMDFNSSVQTIILDIGKNGEITPDLPVLDINGLVGKVISVGDRASMVQLITDKNFRVSVRVGEKRSLGIFTPTHGTFGKLDGIQKSLVINPGDIVVTSGISDIFPADIPVAVVLSAHNDEEHGFQDVFVELLGDVYNLNYVFIVH